MVLHATQSVLSLLLLIAVGYYITGKPWFGSAGSSLFSKFTVNVAIPCYMVYNVLNTCGTRQALADLAKNLAVPMLTILLFLVVGLLLARIFNVQPPRRGVFINAVTFSNTVIVGFPVVAALFGEEAMPYSMVYYMANTLLFWTAGTFLLRQDGAQKARLLSLKNLQKVFSPPVLGMLAGVLLVLLNVTLPSFILSPLTMLKECTTPIAMIFIGSVIRLTDFKCVTFTRHMILVLVVRFLVSPLFVVLLCTALPMDPLMKQVFFVMATMPAMTQLGIMAKESGSDCHFASVLVATTTAVSMFVLPVYMFIIVRFGLFA